MTQSTIKKEGKFSFRCSEDKSKIEMYRKENDQFTTYEECDGECQIIDNIPICIPKEIEEVKKATPSYTPVLVVGSLFMFILWKKSKR